MHTTRANVKSLCAAWNYLFLVFFYIIIEYIQYNLFIKNLLCNLKNPIEK